MTKLIAARTAQTVLEAEFTFNFDDTMKDVTGVEKDFGKTNTASTVFEVINLPENATVVGGEVVTETAFDAASYNISVGDSASATRYLAATDKKGTGRTALVPTGDRLGNNIRITVVPADACTGGKATVRVLYTVKGRATEVCAA